MTWKMLLRVALCLVSSVAAAQENGNSASIDPEINGVRILFMKSPVVAVHDLQIDVAGTSFGAMWRRSLEKVFEFTDGDGNGLLDAQESHRLPTEFELRRILWGNFFPPLGLGEDWTVFDLNHDGKLNLNEVQSYYGAQGIGVTVGLGQSPNTETLNRALRQRLDINQDGIVSATEMDGLVQRLTAADANNDELVSADELVPGTVYPGCAGTTRLKIAHPSGQVEPSSVHVFLLDKNADHDIRSLVSSASPRDENNSAASSDGSPWHARWRMALGDSHVTLLPSATDQVGSKSAALRIHVWPDEGKLPAQVQKHREQLDGKFVEADVNREGFLTADNAVLGKDATLRQLLQTADRNQNARLEKAELQTWANLIAALARNQVLITLLDYQSGLYEYIDADRDGLLSVRELRGTASSLRQDKILEDSGLAWDRLPQNWSIIVSRGHPQRLMMSTTRDAPAWFQGMDRNGDGDVSRREFLAGESEFNKLDGDQDGLISTLEAKQAKPSSR